MLNDLLTVSRADAGTLRLKPVAAAVADQVSDVVRATRQAWPDATILVEEPIEHMVVVVDPGRFAQMLGNLLVNAIQHGLPPVRIGATRRAEDVEITVLDSGPGVPPEARDRLFERFGTTTGGTGLGLYIVRELARAHGGDVAYRESDAAFVLTLPLGRRWHQLNAEGPTPDTHLRVVLVDDAEDVLSMVRTALRLRGGFDVVGQARSGVQAVDLTRRLRPDVVVLDLGLPDLAGQELLTRIREVSAGTQVVVLSGSVPDDQGWFEERTAGYVLKDQELDYLLDLLENLAPRSGDVRRLALAHHPRSAGRAREWVRSALADWSLENLVEDALVVVSELVGNAVRHRGLGVRDLRLPG